jgi:uncharacterized protein YecT (DUF1311 family)
VTNWLFLLSPWLALACLIIWDASKPAAKFDEESVDRLGDELSPDFKALVATIKREGRAYRKEEQREDRGKQFREWITIGLIAITFVAICYQVYEMIKVYEPIKEQAVASTKQAAASEKAADATTRAADANTKAAEAATKQSENSDKALIQSQRAWVGPRDAHLDTKPTVGQKSKFLVEYQNTGKEPALDFVFDAQPFVTTEAEEINGVAVKKMLDYMKKCIVTHARILAGVVYPSSGFTSGSSLSVQIPDSLIDEGVVTGKKSLIIQGCFAYQAGNVTRHSAFCFFYSSERTDIAHLNVCISGNYAD